MSERFLTGVEMQEQLLAEARLTRVWVQRIYWLLCTLFIIAVVAAFVGAVALSS